MGILSYIQKKKQEHDHNRRLAMDQGIKAKEEKLKLAKVENDIRERDAAVSKALAAETAKARSYGKAGAIKEKITSGLKSIHKAQAERFEQRKKEGRAYGVFGAATGIGDNKEQPKAKGKKKNLASPPAPEHNVFGGGSPFKADKL